MNSYKVLMTEPAANDLLGIAHYITDELRAPAGASRLVVKIREAVMSLSKLPTRHPLVADERLALQGIRKIPVDNYIIFYLISQMDETVTVIRILNGSRNWVNLL